MGREKSSYVRPAKGRFLRRRSCFFRNIHSDERNLPTAQSVSDLPGYSDPYKKATPLPFGMHSRAWGDPEWITAHPIPSPNQTLCCGVWLPQNTVAPYPSPGPWLRISHFGKVPDTQCRACASVQPALDSALDLLPAPSEPHPAPPEPPPAPLAHAGHLTSAQTRRPRGAPRPMGPAAPPVTRSPTALILMPPRQLAAVPGGAPRPGPARLRGGKAAAVRGRHRRRAPPSHPRGAGQAAPPHPGPHRGGTGLRRPGPAPPGGGGSAEAAGEGGRGPGRRRRSPESGRGERVGLSWRSSARWSRVGARQPGCGRPGLRRAAPARGQHPRQGNAVRERGRRRVFLLLPEIKRCRRLAPGTASSGCAGKGPFPAAAQQEAQPPGTPLFEAGSPPGAPAFTRQREAVPGGAGAVPLPALPSDTFISASGEVN